MDAFKWLLKVGSEYFEEEASKKKLTDLRLYESEEILRLLSVNGFLKKDSAR